MTNRIMISGFADEIDEDLDKQLTVVKKLGMQYISLRSAYGKNIASHTMEELEDIILPKLQEYDIKVSSIGSPIGKIFADDEEAFVKQMADLERLCKMANRLDCKYIRIFSFYIPREESAFSYRESILEKLSKFLEIAKKYKIILIHENEKDIYGDTYERCLDMMQYFSSANLKLAFDFANFVQCKEDIRKAYEALQSHISYIHIKDALYESGDTVVVGRGDGKVKEILSDIVAKGYRGFLTLEPHLAIFKGLEALELKSVEDIIKKDLASSGEEAYAWQYEALNGILSEIEKESGSCFV